jgi:hypothetical protein
MDDDAAGMRRSPMPARKAAGRYLTTSLWFVGLVAREWMRGRARTAAARPVQPQPAQPQPADARPAEASAAAGIR